MSVAAVASELEPIRVRSKFFFEGERKWFLKGVTYGPFRPNADGDMISSPEMARRDFEMMREVGINLIRVYHVPPRWLLDLAAEFGLRVMISIPWTQHVEFLQARDLTRQVIETVRNAVGRHRGHPAIFAYLVGNEIHATMVRWLGARRVIDFVERLIDEGRSVDSRPMFSYATYPPTEYLIPQNGDFLTYNVYLERRTDFERYLARLQNLVEDKPLIFGEFGLDTLRNGEERQAEILEWHVDAVVRGGAAGTVFFSWTDEWYTNGQEVTDWKFGLVTAGRTPKKACAVLREKLAGPEPMTSRARLARYPKVSVIVCSYNGAATLRDCLEALDRVSYPDFEVILVDDGSTDNTQEIVAQWLTAREELKAQGHQLPEFQCIRQENMGLSHARNAGAAAAKGEVFAYTDCDCMPDPGWLYYLVGGLLSGNYAGVGGPNIPPPARNWINAAVAAAPGSPSHVLLTDVEAEHVPGCNMAFHRWAFESVGGFDPEYRKAGDDVDFCWRLQSKGGVVAFAPSAVVWHYRRFTLNAFRSQQAGYGEAEAMLRYKHLIFFGPTGQAKWKGQIYGAPRFTWLFSRPVIYHGVFGQGMFQSIYPAAQSAIAGYLASIEWVALTVFMSLLSVPFERLRVVPYLMFLGTLSVALSYMASVKIEPRFDTIRARLLVGFLALVQPLVRGWARYFTWLKFKRTPVAVIFRQEARALRHVAKGRQFDFWNENGVGREVLLAEIFRLLESEGWRYSWDTGWKRWDVQIYGHFWWIIKVRTVTELHGGPKCLTRVRLGVNPVATTVVANAVLVGFLLYRKLFTGHFDLLLLAVHAIFLLYLWRRMRRLRVRVAELVAIAAAACVLTPIDKEQARARPLI